MSAPDPALRDHYDCSGSTSCALCPADWCEDHDPQEEATECPDLGWLCASCSDGHVHNCTTCLGIAREDAAQDMADAIRKGEW